MDIHVHSLISTWNSILAIMAIGYPHILVDIQSGYPDWLDEHWISTYSVDIQIIQIIWISRDYPDNIWISRDSSGYPKIFKWCGYPELLDSHYEVNWRWKQSHGGIKWAEKKPKLHQAFGIWNQIFQSKLGMGNGLLQWTALSHE